jgi:hypothetical protein
MVMARYIVLLSTNRPLSQEDAAAWTLWTEELNSGNRLESADLLLDEGRVLTPDSGAGDLGAEGACACAVIYAEDLEEAVEVASGFPDLSEGEELTVRPILATDSAEIEEELSSATDPVETATLDEDEEDDDELVR